MFFRDRTSVGVTARVRAGVRVRTRVRARIRSGLVPILFAVYGCL